MKSKIIIIAVTKLKKTTHASRVLIFECLRVYTFSTKLLCPLFQDAKWPKMPFDHLYPGLWLAY